MKKRLLILKRGLILFFVFSSSACVFLTQVFPTNVPPTQVFAETNTSGPVPAETVHPTSTPVVIPTLAFYSIDPTIVATAESCSVFPDTICVPGVNISLSGRKLDQYEVEVNYPGFSGTSFDCPQQALLISFGENMAPVICNSERIMFVSLGLTEMTITINWEGGFVAETVHPVFEIIAPQGPDCEPQCMIGSAKIDIP